MKSKRKIRIALALVLALLWSSAAPMFSASASSNEAFYKELSALIKSQDDSCYFGSMNISMDELEGTGDGAAGDALIGVLNAVATAAGAKISDKNGTVVFSGRSGETITFNDGNLTIDGEDIIADGALTGEDIGAYYLTSVSEALDLKMDWSDDQSSVTISAPYQTARILAWAKNLDTSGLNASKVIHGEKLWVMQFDTPAEAKAAHMKLEAKGVSAAPDFYTTEDEPVESGKDGISDDGKMSAMGGYNSWGVKDCKFPEFINKYADQMSGEGIVAVIDSGVDAKHSYLKDIVLTGWDFVDSDDDASDENGHGTHVSGTIIDCVGDSPVSILPIRVLDADGNGYNSDIICGIEYACDHGTDVINMSLGGSRGSSEVMEEAIAEAVSMGVIVVVAAGNESTDTELVSPAYISIPGNVVVSAGDNSHSKASFSNYGKSVDIMAPGVAIKSCVPGNNYDTWNGTSMATPHVAAAAMLLDLATGETLTPDALEKLLQSASTVGNWTDTYQGYGFLDMSKVDVPSNDTPPTPDPTPDPDPVYELPFADSDSIKYPEAVAKLVELNVVGGFEDKTFRPRDSLTRAQACKILTLLYGLEPGSEKTEFSDISGHWAEDYIKCCASLGIVSGYGNGKFGPNDVLIGDAWAKMLLCAMGFDAEDDGMFGDGWADGVAELADETGLESGISEDYDSSQQISREEACLLAYNSIKKQEPV